MRLGALAWLLTFLAMTALFPYPGARGGFFHSGAATQPLFWAVAPVGLQVFVDWGSRRRGWRKDRAGALFGVGLVLLAVMLTALIVQGRVLGPRPSSSAWDGGSATYARLERALRRVGAGRDEVVMVNNPPGYYLASSRPAIVIPDGDVDTILDAARHYQARYLWLEANHPELLASLYRQPGDRPGLRYLGEVEGARLFAIESHLSPAAGGEE